MEPTLQVHDMLLANEIEYRLFKPHDGDIVVFSPPIPSSNVFIKRIIGAPGDRLRIHGGKVYRNGVALDEPYIAQETGYELEIKDYNIYVDGQPLDPHGADIPPKDKWQEADRVPDGCYLVLGDNRNNSEDSHIWGFAQSNGRFFSGIEANQPAGSFEHATFMLYPSSRVGIIK